MKKRFRIGETVIYRPTPNIATFHKVVSVTKTKVTLKGIRGKHLVIKDQWDPKIEATSILVLRANDTQYRRLDRKQLSCIQNEYNDTWSKIKHQRPKLVQFVYPHRPTIICSFEKVENILSHYFDKRIYTIRMTNLTVYNPQKV